MFCTIKKSKMLRRRGEIARRRGPRVFDCSAVAAAALPCVRTQCAVERKVIKKI